MLVSEVMTKDVRTARADSTLAEAAAEMNKYRVGSLVVVSGSGTVGGIITERDMIKAMEKDLVPSKTKVVDFMTKKDDLIMIEENATLEEAAEAMTKYEVKKLPVVDNQENLVGIITATDLISHKEDVLEKFAGLMKLKKKLQGGIAS